MTTQLLLTPARVTDPATSHAAAEAVQGNLAWLEAVVLGIIAASAARGVTNHDIVAQSGLPWNTCTPRVRPLVRKGLVKDSGQRRPGPTSGARKCIVWVAV